MSTGTKIEKIEWTRDDGTAGSTWNPVTGCDEVSEGCDHCYAKTFVWLGVSVEDQKRAELRIPALIQTPAAVRFLSCEPLLGPVDLSPWLGSRHQCPGELTPPGNGPARVHTVDCCTNPALDWVIIGGESGPSARPMHPDWARALLDQCQADGVAVFVKQLGAVWARHHHTDPRGTTWSRWPQVLRVRDYPQAGAAR